MPLKASVSPSDTWAPMVSAMLAHGNACEWASPRSSARGPDGKTWECGDGRAVEDLLCTSPGGFGGDLELGMQPVPFTPSWSRLEPGQCTLDHTAPTLRPAWLPCSVLLAHSCINSWAVGRGGLILNGDVDSGIGLPGFGSQRH